MYNCIIMGAAGRDFHDFKTFFVDHPEFRVRAFTATQIPFIAQRSYPRAMAGEGYDADIPIHDEEELPRLIAELQIDFVFFAYSDLPHREVMHRGALVQAAGASFVLLGPGQTMLPCAKPVVAITATRTGAGKSPLTQWLASDLTRQGVRVATIRHPMPYGNLRQQAVQRFAEPADLDAHHCTIEEREEYEPYIRRGLVIYAGVDYRAVLRQAEAEADIILWDGGNNDFSFVRPDLTIVVSDALRAGHGLDYYPGETNFRSADILVINKVAAATAADIDRILSLKEQFNPGADVVQSDLEVSLEQSGVETSRVERSGVERSGVETSGVDASGQLRDKRVLIVEDGPTVTHGGMAYGAGMVAAQQCEVADIIDPRSFAVGTLADTFAANPHLQRVLPAMGYSAEQRAELKATIEASGADLVVNASPADIATLLELSLPVVQVRYRFVVRQGVDIVQRVRGLL